MIPVALTIAGSDPSGGAGLQADLKTFHQHGVYGTSVVTLLTVQNTIAVEAVRVLDPDFVLSQLKAVISDIPPRAAKTGALGNPEIIDALLMRVGSFDFPLVVDPVMISKHGTSLLDSDGTELLKRRLLPFSYLVTPNIPEAIALSERQITDVKSMETAAITISKLGAKNVLIKGGHLQTESACDVLYTEGNLHRLESPHIVTSHTHGTGCVLSAAITAHLARGSAIGPAVKAAKGFISRAIESAPGLGKGHGPLNLFARSV